METMRIEIVKSWQKLYEAYLSGNSTAVFEVLKEDSTVLQSVGVTLLLGVVTLFLLVFLTGKLSRRKKQVVLLLGPSNSGKTTLFSKLSGSDWIGTLPSLSPNFGFIEKDGGSEASMVHLVDLPGSPGLAHQIPKHIKQATAMIFMIDSAEFLQNLHDTAEKMCQVLDNPHFRKRNIPMLIALNKADLGARCNTERFVCTRLQKEIDQVRSQNAMKTKTERPFDFESVKSVVTVARISVILETGLEPVDKFLKKYAK